MSCTAMVTYALMYRTLGHRAGSELRLRYGKGYVNGFGLTCGLQHEFVFWVPANSIFLPIGFAN